MFSQTSCPLCRNEGEHVVWRGPAFRLIRAAEPLLPAFYRVVWNAHVAEFSDLSALDRLSCMDAVALAEQTLRATLQPDKINLASLGNVVPHLHWHVIARWGWDAFWPQSAWSAPPRPADEARLSAIRAQLSEVDSAMQQACAARFGDA
ncbi:MAG: HIT family protein [Pseudomonadota bacterium]